MRQYVDANGRPDPNGDFELIGGKQILRDGRSVSSVMLMRDSAVTTGTVTICDAQCGMIVAKARAEHQLRTAYMGDGAPEFTDAMAQAAVDRATAAAARSAGFIQQYTADAALIAADTEAVRAARANRYHNGWRD